MSRGGICGRKTKDGRLTEFEAFENIGYDIRKQNYDDISRSNGIIDITEDGIKNAIEWAEALEEFNFDYETFTNNEFPVCPKDNCDWIDNLSDIPRWEPDERYVDTILWDDADAALKWFKNTPRYDGNTLGVDENGNPVFATE